VKDDPYRRTPPAPEPAVVHINVREHQDLGPSLTKALNAAFVAQWAQFNRIQARKGRLRNP
jgi:hypothetical protein